MRKLNLNSYDDVSNFMDYVRQYYQFAISSQGLSSDFNDLLVPQYIGNIIRRYAIGEADILAYGSGGSVGYIYVLYKDKIKDEIFPYALSNDYPVVYIGSYDEGFDAWQELTDHLREEGYTNFYLATDADFSVPISGSVVFEDKYTKILKCSL